MIKSRIAMAGALLAVAGAANAGFEVTPAITTDYDWRGISQTNPDQDDDLKPAFQLGLNYAFDNGFYLGGWGSNIDWGPGDPNVELDFFGGYAGGSDETFNYDLGVNYYSYPSAGSSNFVELYAGISKGWFSSKLWYSPEFAGKHTSESAFYLEGNVSVPLPQGLSALGHVGHSFGNYFKTYGPTGGIGKSYSDWSVGLGYDINKFSLSVKYVDGSDGLNGRFIGMISTTLPWSAD